MPNGLWSLPFTSNTSPHQANGILRTDKPKQELATYLHAALSSPATSTLLRAIRRGHLTTIPGLTTNLISKHLPKSIATTLGHQHQEAKHLRSTKSIVNPSALHTPPQVLLPVDSDLAPPSLLEPKVINFVSCFLENKNSSSLIQIKPASFLSPPVEAITTCSFSTTIIRIRFMLLLFLTDNKLPPAFVMLGKQPISSCFKRTSSQSPYP
jgi:hypothetical protein